MQIGGIAKGLNTPVAFGGASEALELGEARAAATQAAAGNQAQAAGPSFRDILSQYNVHHITPREFSELVQKLHEAGQINDKELQELTAIRLELDQSQADADRPLDLLAFFQQRLAAQEKQLKEAGAAQDGGPSSDRDAKLGAIRKQVEWLQKFATVQTEKTANPVDFLA